MVSRERPLILFVQNGNHGGSSPASLLEAEFLVSKAREPAEALQRASRERPDLIILDTEFPQSQDLQLCQELRGREETKEVPIFLLSERTDTKSKVGAFQNGADDFIERPYSMEELRARVGARLRGWRQVQRLRTGNLELDLSALSATIKGKPVIFSLLEFNLLRFFVENHDRVIERDEILASVWPEQNVKARTIDTHLVSIRKKLRGAGIEIASLYGAGYILRKKK